MELLIKASPRVLKALTIAAQKLGCDVVIIGGDPDFREIAREMAQVFEDDLPQAYEDKHFNKSASTQFIESKKRRERWQR